MSRRKLPNSQTAADHSLRDATEGWITRVNALLEGEARIFCQNRDDPRIVNSGEFPLTAEQRQAAEQHRSRFAAMGEPDEQSAALVNDPHWDLSPVCLETRQMDFASVCALRDEGLAPQLLSACSVLVCGESGELLINQRSRAVATYPGRLHTFGGSYRPPSGGDLPFDHGGLRSTIEREVREETQISLAHDSSVPSLMAKELGTEFIQMVFLGHRVSRAAVSRARSSWEGRIILVPFAELGGILRERDSWVPSGMAHVLAWLALGAPGADPEARFGELSAKELFAALVDDT